MLKGFVKWLDKLFTREKSIKKHTRTLKQTLIIYAVGSLICIYMGWLCGAVWMPGNDFNQFMNNFQQFILIEHHFIVGVTHATPIFIGSFWLAFSLAFIMIATRFEHPFAGEEYGVAKWGNAKDFTKEFANHDKNNEVVVVTGDVVFTEELKVNTKNYWLAEGVYVSIDNVKTSNLNMLVVGPPGSGKSFRLARPMLSQLCGNFLVTDPKGELYKQTGQYFEDNGYEVMVMNVESEEGMPMSIYAVDPTTDMLVLMVENVYIYEAYDNTGNKVTSKDETATAFTVYVTPDEVENLNIAICYGGIQMYLLTE